MLWRNYRNYLFACVCGIVIFIPKLAAQDLILSAETQALDVVLVMDSSGSMKRSDPQDLRKPAAKLFISLLGTKDRASIVSFSDKGYPVAFLTPVKGNKNRKKLFAAVDKISTRGVYTNLHGAIDTAAKILDKSGDPDHKQVIVLMSDGKMDVGDSNEAGQLTNNLLGDLLPQLKNKNIEVQTLAFTSESDQELLKKIALQSNGKFNLANTDKDLHAVFTDIFEHNKQPDMIPFNGEKFTIDSSIKEITVVGSKDAESVILSLLNPVKKVYNAQRKPANIKWSQSTLFDLITITKPEPGEWQIKASSGKNKAYVITDLQIRLDAQPRTPAIGEGVLIKTWLENNNNVLTKQKLRADVSAQLHVRTPEDQDHELAMEPEPPTAQQQNSGIFTSLIALPTSGRHEIKVVAKTSTFSRERMLLLNVVEPEKQADMPAIPATPEPPITTAQNEQQTPVQDSRKPALPSEQRNANRHEDKPINSDKDTTKMSSSVVNPPHIDPIKEETTQAKAKPDAKTKSKSTNQKTTKKSKKPKDSKSAKTTEADKNDDASTMAMAIYVFVGVNVALLLIGGIIYLIIRKKNKKSEDADTDAGSESSPEDE